MIGSDVKLAGSLWTLLVSLGGTLLSLSIILIFYLCYHITVVFSPALVHFPFRRWREVGRMLTSISLLASPMLIGLKEISVWIQDLIDESQGPTYDCDFPQKIHMAKTVSNWSEMKPCGQTTMKKLYHSQTLYM